MPKIIAGTSRPRSIHRFPYPLICVLLSVAVGGKALAATLTNDTCARAMSIPSVGPFPYLTPVIPNISEATANEGPIPSCFSFCTNGIWFRFQPALSQTYRFTLDLAETFTSVPDTIMALYSSTGPCSGLTEIACSDDAGCLNTSEIILPLTAGQTYYLGVWKWGSSPAAAGETAIQMGVSIPMLATLPPTNDLCSTAAVIPSTGPFPYLTLPVDISKAGTASDPLPVCVQDDPAIWGVWYQFRPATNGTYNFSTCYDTATTVCDTIMAIYGSPNDCATISPNPIACSDDACEWRAALTVYLSSATNYYLVVWGKESDPPSLGHTLVQIRASELRPRIMAQQRKSDGAFQMEFSGIVGRNYTIQASTNLKAWAGIGQSIGHVKGTNSFTDPGTNAAPARHYRLMLP